MAKKSKIVLLDGSGLAYRAFYALPPLKTSRGEPVNAVYGFTTMLLKVLEEEKPDFVAASFDRGAPTVRLEQYQDYKVHRQKMPEDLTSQLPAIEEVLKVFGIPEYSMAGYEADDCLGTIARKAVQDGMEVTIVSADMDLLQLVSPGIRILATRKGISETVTYDEERVREKFNLEPSQLVELKALAGDTSDHIPGLPGVGETTAKKLLQEYGSIDRMLSSMEVLPPKLRESILKNREQVILSKSLATVVVDLPISISWEDCRVRPPSSEKMKELFSRLEFKSILKKFEGAPASLEAKTAFLIIEEEEALKKLIPELKQKKQVALFPLMDRNKSILGLALCAEDMQSLFLPLEEDKEGSEPLLPFKAKGLIPKEATSALAPIMADPGITKIGHDLKTFASWEKRYGLKLRGNLFDLSLAAYLLDPGEGGIRLSDLSSRYLKKSLPSEADLYGRGTKAKGPSHPSPEELYSYAASCCIAIWDLAPILQDLLERDGLLDLYLALEMPLIPVLVQMENRGVCIDVDYLATLSKEMAKDLAHLEKEIYAIAGRVFNLNSPKQMAEVLFKELGLPAASRTKTGYSTDAEVLGMLATKYPIAQKILQHRELAKLKSTYVDALPRMVNPHTGRLHTTFNQVVTATGRLSSSEPNLQNIPIRSEAGRKIRKAFTAGGNGLVLLAADYSQVELRILAHLSGDEKLTEAFSNDEDIHTSTALRIFGVPQDRITKEMRRRAKEINFGIIYGMSAHGLASRIGSSRTEAAAYIEKYLEHYQGVKKYLEGTIRRAELDGYVSTLFGRKRRLPQIGSRNANIKKAAERMAVNAPIQGTAADIMKLAMVRIHKRLQDVAKYAQILLQVHDELILEVEVPALREVARMVKEEMENVCPLSVRLKVGLEWGRNWADLEDLAE